MQPLVEKYRPMRLMDFAGLDKVRGILSSVAASPYESAWLFVGPSGTGKTTAALAFAKEIGAEVHHIPSRKCDLAAVEEVCERCWYVPMFAQWHLVLVDEADQMSKPAQLAFLSKLDTTAKPPNTIFVFTANSTAALEDRFLSRVRTLKFATDGMAEPAADLLRRVWTAEAPGVAAPDFKAIVKDAGTNVREALMSLELELLAQKSKPAPVKPASHVQKLNGGTTWVIMPKTKAAYA